MHGCLGGMHGCSGGGVCMVAPGGCMVARGACMVAPGGHAWFYLGACMVLFGGVVRGFIRGACMVLFGGHAWFYLGGHVWFYSGGHVWFYSGGMRGFSVFSDTMRYGQSAGGTHPTGMHSCVIEAIGNFERVEDDTFLMCKVENWMFEYFADT